jgi:hypothetical protein
MRSKTFLEMAFHLEETLSAIQRNLDKEEDTMKEHRNYVDVETGKNEKHNKTKKPSDQDFQKSQKDEVNLKTLVAHSMYLFLITAN